MNPGNAVARLCAVGMRAGTEGRADAARELFERAWGLAADEYEACAAAHHLARRQTSPEAVLHWNQECPDRVTW
ncbi:hypothetical protein ACIQXD_12630 [Streptomyces uncialis]|uniref:hypothetical protein n=1 Tax=Streptomyces uncialis TaxID=1048205 RepID=UPI0038216E58